MLKINSLEVENVKRVKAVKINPTPNGLTIIGGGNSQGKTSVLDAIAWALGGDRYKPSNPNREGSVTPAALHVELSNGLVVERKGKNGDLKVIDSTGKRGGQQLLNAFVSQLALDLPKFLNANNKEKADTLLNIIGVGKQLYEIEDQISRLYNRRREIGIIADQKKKYAEELQFYPDVSKEIVSASELIKQQQAILARNGENQRKREQLKTLMEKEVVARTRVHDLKAQLETAEKELTVLTEDIVTASKTVEELQDESTAELEAHIANVDSINIKVRANADREKAEIDAEDLRTQYDGLSEEIESLRQAKIDLLKNADLPLTDLSVENGELIYKGQKWDGMSGSEQLKLATAIIRKLNPECGFILIDKLEQMDATTLQIFAQWVEEQGLQIIATRVSTGDECSIIIEDGYVVKDNITTQQPQAWKAGEF